MAMLKLHLRFFFEYTHEIDERITIFIHASHDLPSVHFDGQVSTWTAHGRGWANMGHLKASGHKMANNFTRWHNPVVEREFVWR